VDTLSEAVKDRLVFLAALTDKRVGFEIRSLQEFMAADFLMDAPDANDSEHDDSVRNRLESIAKVAHWRNVFLFAAGRTFAKEQRFRDSLEALCLRLNDSLDDPATRSNLGGSRLALDLIEDGSARNQPNSSRTLMRVAARLLDVPASKEHIRLVHQSDASTEGVVKEELERRLTSNNDFAWLTCWVALEDPCRRDKAWARDLASLHSPIEPSRVLNAFRVMRDAETDGPLTMLIAKEAHKLPIWDALRLFSSSGVGSLREVCSGRDGDGGRKAIASARGGEVGSRVQPCVSKRSRDSGRNTCSRKDIGLAYELESISFWVEFRQVTGSRHTRQ
jgi:hypothetical protein